MSTWPGPEQATSQLLRPGSVLGDGFLGTGVVTIPGVVVGDRPVVGAGAVVIREVAAETTVVGVPARKIAKSS